MNIRQRLIIEIATYFLHKEIQQKLGIETTDLLTQFVAEMPLYF